jgi:hypothetical protein
LSRPLDWLVISDHAEMYGLMPQLLKGDPGILATEEGRRWYDITPPRVARTRFRPYFTILSDR